MVEKSLKIKIALTIIWGVLTGLFSGVVAADSDSFWVFVGTLIFLNLPTLMYWLGFWVWGQGYIFKSFSFLVKKIGLTKNGLSISIFKKVFSAIAAIFVLFLAMALVASLEDFFISISETTADLWNVAGFVTSVILAIKTYQKFTGIEKDVIREHIPLPNNHKNYFIKHWFGELSLPVSYWVNGALLNILVTFTITIFVYDLTFTDHPRETAFALIFMWLAVCLLTVWQVFGVWRSAAHYSKYSKKSWGKVAQVFTVIGVLGFTSTILQSGIPQIKEFWNIGSGNDPLGTYSLRVLRDATELEFSGHIGFGATNKVAEYLNGHPAIKIIHLNSMGGRVAEARNLAELIEKKALTTYTSKGCYSACVIAFAAGKDRLIEKNADLGFHQYDFPGMNQEDFYYEYQTDKKFLKSKGIAGNFINRIFETPPSEFWKPTHAELLDANFITKYPDYDDVALTTIGLSEIELLENTLLEIPLFVAVKENAPEAYAEISASFKTAVERGQSISEVRKVSLPVIRSLLFEKLAYASGEALIEFTKLMVDQLSFYQTVDPHKCYAYSMGTKEGENSSDLPQELVERELAASAKVITSYSQLNKVPTEDKISEDLQNLFLHLAETYGEDILLIINETHSYEEQPRHCAVTIAMYEEILKLPTEKADGILRYMFSQI